MPASSAAARLGLPIEWLKQEAEASRIPSIRIGRKLFFNPSAVERALLERATQHRNETAVAHA